MIIGDKNTNINLKYFKTQFFENNSLRCRKTNERFAVNRNQNNVNVRLQKLFFLTYHILINIYLNKTIIRTFSMRLLFCCNSNRFTTKHR